MNHLTTADYIHFFRRLDVMHQVELLNELTNILTIKVKQLPKSETSPSVTNDEEFVNSLFGIWEQEDELDVHAIVDRK